MKETISWICLSKIFGPANQNLWKLMNACSCAAEGYQKVSEGRFQLTSWEKKQFLTFSQESAAVIIKQCSEKNIQIITYTDERYPSKLKTIYNPPAVLYALGNTDCLKEEISLSVVGTRYPSEYSYGAARKISGELAQTGFVIVSGFAAGIDSAAHRGTLDTGGKTIAVLGCGVDVDYPRANSDIRDAVLKNGLFISEFPPGTPPLGKNFPLRNRIISGLSLGVFVVEAPLSSGALITADSAIEQGRDVFCLPPCDIFSKSYQGVVKYLRDGAVPVFSYLDIIYEYFTNFTHKISSVRPSDEYSQARSDSSVYAEKKKRKAADIPVPEEKKTGDYEHLDEEQRKITDALMERNLHIDELCECTGMVMADLLMNITELELSGIILSLPGKIYALV
ncbi:MAG: DNA-processing protein DprA [Oscillospiraceae bacterium]|nr:DNA-processing protein DprA [Oscillospiraceae bacterium]